MRKISSRVLALLILLVVGGVAWRLTHPALSPSQQIERTLDDATQSLQNRSVGGVLSVLSKDFSYSGTSRQETADTLRGAFFQWRDVQMHRSNPSAEVRGETANTRGFYTLTFRPTMDAPFETQRGEYSLEWRLENGDWKVVRASVKPENGTTTPTF
jgi:uncharacterized membrane-anchored protein YhcB (DUF1043 family)